jgi:hypothetical protein
VHRQAVCRLSNYTIGLEDPLNPNSTAITDQDIDRSATYDVVFGVVSEEAFA